MAEPHEGTLVDNRSLEAQFSDTLYTLEMQKQLRLALPAGIDAGRFARLAMTEIRKTPKLLDCNRPSLYGAIMVAGQMGLEIGINGQCWIIPFKGEAQLMVGYRGMIDLAYRSGQIRLIDAKVVREGDEFDYRYGTGKYLHHKKARTSERGKFTHVYSTIETVGGGEMFDVMDFEEVEEIRLKARSQNIWNQWYDAQAKKTILRRNLKFTPTSTMLSRAVSLDEQAELGLDQNLGAEVEPIDVTPKDDVPISPTPSDDDNA